MKGYRAKLFQRYSSVPKYLNGHLLGSEIETQLCFKVQHLPWQILLADPEEFIHHCSVLLEHSIAGVVDSFCDTV